MIELAGDAPLPRELAAGGVFVPHCALRLAEECDLVVCSDSHQLMIPARVVYVDPRGGAGLELLGFSPEMKAQLVELAAPGSMSAELPVPALDAALQAEAPDDDLELPGWDGVRELEAPAVIRDARPVHDDEDGEDDLAIPLSDEDADAAAIIAEPIARPGDAVFAYTKPGLAYRGGVARRAESEAGAADSDAGGADPSRAGRAQLTDAGDAAFSEAGGADFAGALGAELDAELGIGDFADAEPDELAEAAEAGDAAEVSDEQGLELDLIGLEPVGDAAGDAEGEDDGDDADGPPGSIARKTGARARFARNVNERLRGMTLAAQVKMATQGELHERIVLERLYGKNVWEALLRNPRLTAPEVSRIARYGSLPRILIEIIVGNNAWLQIAEIRRALLSNPRLGVDQVMKVLRLTPKHELKLAAIQTAYPHAVRNAAKILMRGDP